MQRVPTVGAVIRNRRPFEIENRLFRESSRCDGAERPLLQKRVIFLGAGIKVAHGDSNYRSMCGKV